MWVLPWAFGHDKRAVGNASTRSVVGNAEIAVYNERHMRDAHLPGSGSSLAVLTSGGLDSAILLAESVKNHSAVWPLYIRTGLTWETIELRFLKRFLEKIACPELRPLQVLDLPVADLYGNHWSLSGRDV